MQGAALPPGVLALAEASTGRVRRAQALGGGQTARTLRVDAENGAFVVKWAEGAAGEGFEAEASGLRALALAAPPDLLVPSPLFARKASAEGPGLLVLPYVPSGKGPLGARFGRALAALHRASADVPSAGTGRSEASPYGFALDTFCGPTRQPNGWLASWPQFFAERRLMPLAEALRGAHRWPQAWDAPFGRLLARLPGLLPERPHPSLVHGDLWSGNAFAAQDGRGVLVDPAAYVGDRETDLAMMELFGFDGDALAAYREAWPLEPGYPERRAVYGLYHLLNHALLFGGGYIAQAQSVLGRLGS